MAAARREAAKLRPCRSPARSRLSARSSPAWWRSAWSPASPPSSPGSSAWSPSIWAAVTMPVLLALLAEIVTSLRRGDLGLDIVAALSMTAALAGRREPGRGHRRPDVCRRPVPGELCRAGGPARDDRLAVAGAAHRHAPPRRPAGGGGARPDRARRPPADAPGRRGAGRRHGGRGRGGARPVGADRRGAAGHSCSPARRC